MLMKKKEDPRSIRSKKMFKHAVFSLLTENPSIADLTVQKISNRADLNRTTFYLHFQDINDLLKQITDEIIDELSNKVDDLIHMKDLSNHEQFVILLDFLYDHRKFIGVLFEMRKFENELFHLLKKLVATRRENAEKAVTKEYVDIDIKVASMTGVIMWWLKDGIHFSSEYIARQMYLFQRPTKE